MELNKIGPIGSFVFYSNVIVSLVELDKIGYHCTFVLCSNVIASFSGVKSDWTPLLHSCSIAML